MKRIEKRSTPNFRPSTLYSEESSWTIACFCKISRKEIPAKLVYGTRKYSRFEDIQPQAPVHILICPRKHFVSLTEAAAEDAAMLGRLQLTAAKLAVDRKPDRRLPHRYQ